MNIFYLSNNPVKCAQYHCDKHVVKMVVETAQLLSTAHRVLDEPCDLPVYKATHKNHPSAIWCRQSSNNYNWLWYLLRSLCVEYTYRYDKIHKCQHSGLLDTLMNTPKNIAIGQFTEPPPAMPDEYKTSSAIQSYMNYYNGAKRSFATWKRRQPPAWFINDHIHKD